MRHSLSKVFLVVILFTVSAQGQKDIPSTEAFTVSGAVEKEVVFTLTNLGAYPSKGVPDIVITNHLGETRGTAKGLRGVAMKDVLKDIVFQGGEPENIERVPSHIRSLRRLRSRVFLE